MLRSAPTTSTSKASGTDSLVTPYRVDQVSVCLTAWLVVCGVCGL